MELDTEDDSTEQWRGRTNGVGEMQLRNFRDTATSGRLGRRTADIFVDSTAALGVVNRKGAGKLRHVRVGQLWVQEKQEAGELRYRKVKGTENPADALTKAMTRGEMEKYLDMLATETRTGRADKGLQMAA